MERTARSEFSPSSGAGDNRALPCRQDPPPNTSRYLLHAIRQKPQQLNQDSSKGKPWTNLVDQRYIVYRQSRPVNSSHSLGQAGARRGGSHDVLDLLSQHASAPA
ncbi:hypothetical protein RRG08_015717 [Elysia crispata]|uniref:Uncharacterized protein n=1 Tax=Elysia crispata TaxID=231223 RepID=A0AAE1DA44_9GAST|nr:hypothetical protein RRG08_015717 [Elysia crispata]